MDHTWWLKPRVGKFVQQAKSSQSDWQEKLKKIMFFCCFSASLTHCFCCNGQKHFIQQSWHHNKGIPLPGGPGGCWVPCSWWIDTEAFPSAVGAHTLTTILTLFLASGYIYSSVMSVSCVFSVKTWGSQLGSESGFVTWIRAQIFLLELAQEELDIRTNLLFKIQTWDW
jgi:hypothetical protein